MTYALGGAGTAQSQWGSIEDYEYYEILQERTAEKPRERAAAKPCERDQMSAEKLRGDENEPKCMRVCPHRVSLFYRFVLHEGCRPLG
jgi:hypothetical protein